MPSYRLPAVLGGGVHRGTPGADTVRFELPDVGVIELPTATLTEIWPDERPDDSFVAVDVPGKGWQVFHRDDDGAITPGFHWWSHDERIFYGWREVCELGAPVDMVLKGRPSRRGVCSGCNALRVLNIDGRVRSHDAEKGGFCRGSHKPPVRVVS